MGARRRGRCSLLLLVGAGLGYYFYVQGKARDIRGSSTVEFVPTEAAAGAAADDADARNEARSRTGRRR